MRSRPFELASADGARVNGQADLPDGAFDTAVVMVAGTGFFDRDVRYGHSGTARDLMFADLAGRFAARGLAAVRYDKRGVRHGVEGVAALDPSITVTATTSAQLADLAAVYAWAGSPAGLGARKLILFGHSEGMLHIGRLALSGAPSPALVIGVGPLMQSPKDVLHWQMVERDPFSIRLLDADGDGVTTNAEVEAGWMTTPSRPGTLEALLSPTGAWDEAGLAQLRAERQAAYDQARTEALATDDAAPYPNADIVAAAFQWWKSWFVETDTVADRLARWSAPVSIHYGSRDSQTNAPIQIAAAEAGLPAERLRVTVHEARGHALGEDPSIGPMDEAIAEALADEAAAAA